MGYMENYEKWLNSETLSIAEKDELKEVAKDAKELEDRFYRGLEFGTAGMRGVLGMGTNRINIYNVRQATYGVAEYVKKEGADAMAKGVLISYDTRIMSREFAEET
ncbi:MAG: phospho-sugar mutase, partial [Oscillospiraceae bacterium]|nr:phospho-sugar mutase [Oscillospiraceae bacterium]